MGGGDLNMKKHFHPLTIENLERVWKAEDKKKREEERIEELQKELQEERQREAFQRQAVDSGLLKKKSEKLDWMYSHQSVNTDEYLLGRRIDKNVEVMKEDDKKTLAEGSKASTERTTKMPKAGDILAKVKEDPLFLIKKREEDNRKELVQNPLKMKKMKALLLQKMNEKNGSKSGREERRHQSSKSYNEDRKTSHRKHTSSSSLQHRRDDDHRDYSRDRRHYESSNYRKDDSRTKKSMHDLEHKNNSHRSHHKSHHQSSSESDSDRHKIPDRKTNSKKRREYSDSDSSDDDEMEAKRKEMLENAKWRQSQREQNIKRHREELVKEESLTKKSRKKENVDDHKAKFIRKMQVESFSDKNASVEDRIRRNIHSKQRTNAALQKKFTSR